jgi:catechol 2,3-dioxygenase-like lactoylglutathione lyase family enzyme
MFINAWGYQGSAMDLPVANVDEAVNFYTHVMGFEISERGDEPVRSVTLKRPDIQMRIAENGGDPTQDGCAFEVDNVEDVLAEFRSNGFQKEVSDITFENSHGKKWKVFYVVAPDGLCFWLGENVT